MKKEKFIKTTIILMIGGAITKVLGMIIKIIMNRLVGIEGIGLYMLIFPTFSLFNSAPFQKSQKLISAHSAK